MFKKIVSFFTVFTMMLTLCLSIPVKTVKAAMPTILNTFPKLSEDSSNPTVNITTDTDIQIKFSKDMDVSTLRLTNSSYISLWEIKNGDLASKKSIFPSDLEKTYDNNTFALTLNTRKYLQKGSMYMLKVKHSLIKSADGDYMPMSPADSTYYYFTTEEDTTPKVSACYFSREFAGDAIVPLLNGDNVPGKSGSKIYIYFSKTMDSTTVTNTNVIMKDQGGNIVTGYNIVEDINREAGRRYILSTTSILNNSCTINFTEDIKSKDGTILDVNSIQVCTPTVMDDGKKAVSFNVIYDATPYKINSASVSLNDGTESIMPTTSENITLVDAKTTGEINVLFNEKIDINKVTTVGSSIILPTVAIYKDNVRISSTLLSANYLESENTLKIKYNTLEPNQLYKLKLLKGITDYVGNSASADSEFYFKTAESKVEPKLFKVFYDWSSLGEKKSVTDLTQNIGNIRIRTNNESSKPCAKIYFDMNVKTNITSDKDLNETTDIRVFDKNMNIVNGFFFIYNSDESSFSIFTNQDANLEVNNPYYIAITNNVVATSSSKEFLPVPTFGGEVKTLADGSQAILLPFNFDIAPPKYTVEPKGDFGTGGLKKPIELATNGTITVNFNEPMNITDSLYGLRHDAKNIILAVRRDDAVDENEIPLIDVNYDEVILSESEYIVTPTSVTLKPDWSKYGVGKTFRLNVKEFKISDEAGWTVTSEMYAYSWFTVKSPEILPTFEVTVIDKPEYFTLGKDAKIKIQAINNSKGEGMVSLVMGLFDENDILVNYIVSSQFLASGKDMLIQGQMSLPKKGQYKVKCFVWDTLENMNSLSIPIEIPVK